MATAKITKRAVDAFAASGEAGFLWDDELRGFGVRATAGGALSYVFSYRMGGREAVKKRATIGKHGSPWTPTTARQEAERLALLVGQGKDPVEQDRERRRQAVDLAFDAYIGVFRDGYLKTEWKDWQRAEKLLLAQAKPVLLSKSLPSITKSDLTLVIDRVRDRPAVARLLFATLRKLFRWAETRGDLDRSPLTAVKAPKAVKSRERTLNDRELAMAWDASAKLGYPFGPMMRLLMATGQRREEVGGLQWAELDRTTATWTLPAERAKNGKEHVVPLSSLAVTVFDELAQRGGEDATDKPITWPRRGLVFTTTGKTAASGHSKAKSRLDSAIAAIECELASIEGREPVTMPAWRVHDIRRTVATGFQVMGVRFEVTEAVLNHVSGSRSGVAGVYQRHNWADEKRTALEAWARRVIELTSPAKPDSDNVFSMVAA